MTARALLPCPFCGCPVILHSADYDPDSLQVFCDECGGSNHRDNWNMRIAAYRRGYDDALAHSRAQDSGGEAFGWWLVDDNGVGRFSTLVHPSIIRDYQSKAGFQAIPLYTAAEQPAKGKGCNCASGRGSDHCPVHADRAWDNDMPQPSDPADADVPRCPKCGYTHEDCLTHMDHHLCGEQSPPPTAQRHDDASRFFIDHGVVHDRKTGKHLVSPDGAGETADALLAVLRELENDAWAWKQTSRALEATHGAGAAVEAVAHAIRLLEWTVAEHVYDAETEADFNLAIQGLESLPLQQRSEQVAGGGGVDDALESAIRYIENASDKTPHPQELLLTKLRAALSTQPLLSDQPAGVSNESLPEFLERVAQELEERDVGPGSFACGVASSLRGRAYILRSVAALHPEQAKDGAAG